MANFTLRFTGRFVFAEPLVKSGGLDVLAMNMQFNPDLRADPHQFLMTAPRPLVIQPGGRPPDAVYVASVSDTDEADQAVWNLTGQNVSFNASGGFQWEDKARLANLNELLERVNNPKPFQKALLSPTERGGLIQGLIRVDAGRGRATQFVPDIVDFVLPQAATTPVGDGLEIADLVTIDLAIDSPLLFVTITPRNVGPSSIVVLSAEGGETILTFSNLCASPNRGLDQEFAGLYEVFNGPPTLRGRLVPTTRAALGGTIDCYPPGSATF